MNIWKTMGLAFTGLAVTSDAKHLREENHSTSVDSTNTTGNSLSAIMSGLSNNNTVAADDPLYRTMKNAGYSDVNYHYTGKETYGADCYPSACYGDLTHNAEQKFAITEEGGFGVFYYDSLSDCADYICNTYLGSFTVTVDYNGIHINSGMDTLVYGCDAKYTYCVQAPDKTDAPTSNPTSKPSKQPTSNPTLKPSGSPSFIPTRMPTVSFAPTNNPTFTPTSTPTKVPTLSPTTTPTSSPTSNPTTYPTLSPTENPTISFHPTATPTEKKEPPTPSWTMADTIGATVGSVVGLAALVAGIFYRKPIAEAVTHCYRSVAAGANDGSSILDELMSHVGGGTGSFTAGHNSRY